VKSFFVLLALLAPGLAAADPNDKLPDFGSPADVALSKSREAQLGRGVMLELRNAGVVVDDPLLTEYVGSLGSQLSSRANDGDFKFHFFFVKDNQINAFALPGGFIGVNAGLLLATNNENELAGVLAHEVSHVTQRHIARAIYDNEHVSIVSMAAMLAAILLGAASNAHGDALAGVVAGTQGLVQQHQINFTRANEIEADRVGMEVLSSAGFDPNGMSSFFEEIGKRYGAQEQYVPALLQSHPVTSERIAEARARARQLPQVKREDSVAYGLAKARMQVLSAPTPEAAFALFKDQGDSKVPAQRYGLALSQMRMNLNDNAEGIMRDLAAQYPTVIAYRIGQAEASMASGSTEEALARYKDAERLFPRNVPLTISYADALIAAGQAAAAHSLLLDLLNSSDVEPTPEQLRLIARAANAEGDVGDAYYYMSYYYGSIGNLPLAISQVRLALETPGVHTIERERFKARLQELIDYLPPEQRRAAARASP
jgi:predicted Zn-dependent protease